jgi:hypothetical protein
MLHVMMVTQFADRWLYELFASMLILTVDGSVNNSFGENNTFCDMSLSPVDVQQDFEGTRCLFPVSLRLGPHERTKCVGCNALFDVRCRR